MWIFRAKKWAARLLLLLLIVGVLLAGNLAIDKGAPTWAHLIVTVTTTIGAFSTYEVFRPQKPLPPADGLRFDDDGPTIQTSVWQEQMAADHQSVRAALLSCNLHEYAKTWIIRPNEQIIQAFRSEDGWEILKGKVSASFDAVAVRDWPGVDPEPVKFKWYKTLGRALSGDRFDNRDTEEILNAFAKGAPEPSFVRWKVIERD